MIFLSCVTMQVSAQEIESPLKQFKDGIPISDIKCTNGQQLIVKKSDNTPACVFPSTISILIERGWTSVADTKIEEPTINNYTKPPSVVFAMFYTAGTNHTNLELFEKYLQPGDYLFITTPLD